MKPLLELAFSMELVDYYDTDAWLCILRLAWSKTRDAKNIILIAYI